MPYTIRLRGRKEEFPQPLTKPDEELKIAYAPSQQVTIGGLRGAAEEVALEGLSPDTLLEIEYAGGAREWVTVEELNERLLREKPDAVRGNGSEIDFVRLQETRGLGGAIESVKTLVLWALDPAGQIAKPGAEYLAEMGAEELARRFEKKLAAPPGLYFLDDRAQLADPVRSSDRFASDPYLVLLHGTFSSTTGSFSELFASQEWKDLWSFYGNGRRILALEHRSLSANPAQNALDIADVLPQGARMHLLSHSRGGLVGELICRGALPPAAYRLFEKRPTANKDKQDLKQLSDLLQEKAFKIERFVRVACPARGTLLAGERASQYLSVFLDVFGYIPAVRANPVVNALYGFVRETILALIQMRQDPRVLPGLEAMVPESAFIRLLNDRGIESKSDLTVISGNAKGGELRRTLSVLASRLYYRENNDFVVHTEGMYGGIPRPEGFRYGFHESPTISHFAYFSDNRSRAQIKGALTTPLGQEPDAQLGFARMKPPLPAAPSLESLRSAPLRTEPRGEVIVVPGIFESILLAGATPVWFDYTSLARQGLEGLGLAPSNGKPARAANAAGLVPELYQELEKHLAGRALAVNAFPYDWRRSLRETADNLSAALERRLLSTPDSGKPLHLLAHGTGCVVVALALSQHENLANRLRARGGRIVFIAPPDSGCYWSAALLTGTGHAFKTFELLDPAANRDAVLSALRSFEPLRELLPLEAAGLPGLGDWTADAEQLRKLAFNSPFPRESTFVIYGSGAPTPAGFDPVTKQLLYRDAGDGVVISPADPVALSPILAGAQRFFARGAHGNLLTDKQMIPAIGSLLEHGRAPQLSATPPPVEQPEPYTLPDTILYPSPEDARNNIFVIEPPREDEFTVSVRVIHGDLRHAASPVVVGHYHTDTIVGAERVLDEALDGALTRRHGMGLYPGMEGTFEMFLFQQSTNGMPAPGAPPAHTARGYRDRAG